MRADGTEIPVELSIARVRVAGPPLFTAHVRNISGRQRVERERAAKEAELELVTSQTPLLLTRCSRVSRYVCQSCMRRISRPVEDIVGRPIPEILGEEAYATITPYIARVLNGEPVDYAKSRFRTHTPDGGSCARSTRPARDGQGNVILDCDGNRHHRAETRGRRPETNRGALEEAHRAERAAKGSWPRSPTKLRAPLNAVLGWARCCGGARSWSPVSPRRLTHRLRQDAGHTIFYRSVRGRPRRTRDRPAVREAKGIDLHMDIDASIGRVHGTPGVYSRSCRIS
jgi:hypothetical protein